MARFSYGEGNRKKSLGRGHMNCDDGKEYDVGDDEKHTEASTLSSIAFLARRIASLGPWRDISLSTSEG